MVKMELVTNLRIWELRKEELNAGIEISAEMEWPTRLD